MSQLSHTGIILAGGKSSRIGQDKGLMHFNGKPMVEHAIGLLTPFCNEIIISSNNIEYHQFGLKVVADLIKEKGPMGGIYTALLHAKNERCIVVGCDMPNINEPAVQLLLNSMSDGVDFNIAKHQQHVEPLFGIYATKTANMLLKSMHDNHLKLHQFLAVQSTLFVNFDTMVLLHPYLFSNINSPSDL